MTAPTGSFMTSLTGTALRSISSSRSASSVDSECMIATVAFSGSAMFSLTYSTSRFSPRLRPFTLSQGTILPSRLMTRNGFMSSIVPKNAAEDDTRPPRFRYPRSSTTNAPCAHMKLAFSHASTSSMLAPSARISTACLTSSPCAIDMASVSNTSMRLPG